MNQPDPNDFAQREPKHPDYEVLDRLALEIGSAAASPDFDPREALGGLVDPTSAIYVGIGKATNFLGIGSAKEMTERLEEVMSTAMFWVDGLHHGIEFNRQKEQS